MNNRLPSCKAYQRGDQLICDRCGFTWDHNDNDPPECNADPVHISIYTPPRDKKFGCDQLEKIKEIFKNDLANN